MKGKCRQSIWLLMIAAGLVSVLASGCGGGGSTAGVQAFTGGSRTNDIEAPPPPPVVDTQEDIEAPPPPPAL